MRIANLNTNTFIRQISHSLFPTKETRNTLSDIKYTAAAGIKVITHIIRLYIMPLPYGLSSPANLEIIRRDVYKRQPECYEKESISCGMLEYPQYTRPENFRGMRVPEVLLGGNHAEIERWRYKAALELTLKNRPDMIY